MDDTMISARKALMTGKANPFDRWVGPETAARARILSRLVVPQGRQTFTASTEDTFFAIGSCFARNVEERLEFAGARVSSRRVDIDDLGASSARHTGLFNKYNPVSMLQELKWAAGIEAYPENALLQTEDDLWYDPHLKLNAGRADRARLMARRNQISGYFSQAFSADVVILTLGLIEAWVDLETGLVLNELPDPKVLARQKERFAFRTMGVKEVSQALAEMRAILAQHGKPGQRIILTVSPVALGRTFTEDDIIIANITSKSTLRVPAHAFARKAQNVDYFPSYEAVLHSDPALAWQQDRLHASDFIVGAIIRTFLNRYGIAQTEGTDPLPESDPHVALVNQMRKEVDAYKNRILKLESTLARAGISVD